MRFFIKIAYNGLPFHGWQSQPNSITVQTTLEKALSKILRQEISIVGAGRTDSGVHAKEMFAHFDYYKDIEDKSKFLSSLNSLAGRDIAVYEVVNVTDEAHARFDALQRTYKYFVSYKKSPFYKDLGWNCPALLDIDKMNEAANLLLYNKDFTSFAKLHSDVKTNICEVSQAMWLPIDADKEAKDFIGNMNNGIVFTISADRFLRNMVRAIVGTLIEVGRGKMSLLQFKDVIHCKNRSSAGTSMPAHGLYLWKIDYPSDVFI